jgi:hypothetical protein
MEVTPPDLIDRIGIIRLKIEHASDPKNIEDLKREMTEHEKAIKEFKAKGITIKDEWFDKLYEINSAQWNLEDAMSEASKGEDGSGRNPNLKKMGETYIEIQKSNKRRVAIKNRITEETGEGFRDVGVN